MHRQSPARRGLHLRSRLSARQRVRPDAGHRTATLVDSSTAAPVSVEEGATFYREVAQQRPTGPPSLESVRVEPVENSWGTDHVTDAFLERRLEVARREGAREARERMDAGARATFFESVDAVRERFLDRVDAGGVPVPALVVWGGDDPSAPLTWGLDLYERVRAETDAAELHVLNRAGHYSFRAPAGVRPNGRGVLSRPVLTGPATTGATQNRRSARDSPGTPRARRKRT
ncbi:MAG: hypothetical protein V5A44_11970 [Haloarculaceae archaeon]